MIKKIGLALAALVAFTFLAIGGLGVAHATPVTSSASGTTVCTTDANGLCIISHDLGKTPTSVVANAWNDQAAIVIVTDAYTTTSFRIKAYQPTGVIVNKKQIKLSWIATAGPATTPTVTPTTTPPTTTPTTPPTTQPTTTPPDTSTPTPTATNADWPNADNTGPADGTTLTDYNGTMTVTTPNTVVDSKNIKGDLLIRTTGVVIKNSVINGEVSNYDQSGTSFDIRDSIVKNGKRDACMCVGSHDFTAERIEVTGGNRGMYCEKNCTIQDSYVHGTDLKAKQHASAIRVEQNTTLKHNTLKCDWTDISDSEIGCSADMTGYPDFAPIKNNTIDGNLFVANAEGIGYCAYGGATKTKPHSDDADNATNIVFKNNVWQRGPTKKCGQYGAITDWDGSRTGNQWINNKWDDGTSVNPNA